MSGIAIAGRAIGPNYPPYIIAEMSGNHNGQIDRAFALIEEAKASGADAVKLQTYTADTITIDHDGAGFRIEGGLWDGRLLYDLYREAHTPWEWHEALFSKGRDIGITVFSSPFDETAIDLLQSLDAPAYKIASFEAADLPLIRRAAATGKPLIISTGMIDAEEIAEALAAADVGNFAPILLHCVSAYPAPVDQANLRTIADMLRRFGGVVGLSDHTKGTEVAVAAVAGGACMIEKHLTLRRADGGPDAEFSLEPAEFSELCRASRNAWAAMGQVSYERPESAKGNRVFRRSLYIVDDVAAGEPFTASNIRSIRPGYGLPPKYLPKIVGRKAAHALKRGMPLVWSMVAQGDDAT